MKLLICLLSVTILAGCAGVPKQYLRADRATYNAIAPEYRAYIRGDEKLSELQRAIRLETVTTWKARINAAGVP